MITFVLTRTSTESFSLDNSGGLNEMILREPPSGIWSLSKLTSLKLHGIGLLNVPESIGEVGFLLLLVSSLVVWVVLNFSISIPVGGSPAPRLALQQPGITS
jgi:hypothetical protein